MKNSSIISIKGLEKSYGSLKALKGLDIEVKKGELFGMVGPDGAGKTTIIRILAGILGFDRGEVRIMGESARSDIEKIRNHIGYVSQVFSLYGDLTVEENIDFFQSLYPLEEDPADKKNHLLQFIGLALFKNRLAANLSGGMKQKLALLCALIHNPDLLLMDEPTTGVDPVSRREFWEMVFKLQKEGLTVLASTPYMDEAEQFDRVALIHHGRIVRIGSTDEIKESVPGAVYEVICSAPSRVRSVLKEMPGVDDVELFGDKVHVFVKQSGDKTKQSIIDLADKSGVETKDVYRAPYSIEDVFLKLTGGYIPGKDGGVEQP